MDEKRYALRWRHHQSTVVAEVGSLYRDAALVDVTLACEDQRTYQAHKLVLSACSQYFQVRGWMNQAHKLVLAYTGAWCLPSLAPKPKSYQSIRLILVGLI